MKLFAANIKDLESLYVNNLKKAYDMEIKITKALPDMIEHCTDAELADAFHAPGADQDACYCGREPAP
jgi:ferritin-like metal-binding protein YciE